MLRFMIEFSTVVTDDSEYMYIAYMCGFAVIYDLSAYESIANFDDNCSYRFVPNLKHGSTP